MTRPDTVHDSTALPANPYNPHAWVIGDPVVGEGTWIGAFTMIDGSGGLTIGTGCDISSGVHVYTHSSARRCVSGRSFPAVERAPVHIGDYVFVGANAVVNMGVTIGDHSVVGAGAVVSRDVPPYTVVAGVPARPIARVDIADDGMVTFPALESAGDGAPGSAEG
ncbi:succinyltransferase-like protein [Blastococcus colisei]|uniref:Succinyltransferase-like protein n=1 Tax=Blastococcus colisei TaxID=1564162 RepID=A0A543PBM9_9ACTN|nr:acyltransferase [Blastococcus colisei]TQN41503.1 succinyltransferase-like protein [Blastococcus colisei]